MKIKYLVLGNGLLGSVFRNFVDTAVLSRAMCDITDKENTREVIKYYDPQVVINCAGIVPKSTASVEQTFKTNSFAPHYLADLCRNKRKLIHISTDCVFSGDRELGRYKETDEPDATDIYGMSKLLGEPKDALVIRTSFIGLPDIRGHGLLAWAEKQSEIIGYDRVLWNGVTTLELADKIYEYSHEDVTGLRHVYSYTLSKYELLLAAAYIFNWKVDIVPETDVTEDTHKKNTTLSSIHTNGFVVKSIQRQLRELL
jgi:dTDP-4-dehydrorhamnose reductase